MPIELPGATLPALSRVSTTPLPDNIPPALFVTVPSTTPLLSNAPELVTLPLILPLPVLTTRTLNKASGGSRVSMLMEPVTVPLLVNTPWALTLPLIVPLLVLVKDPPSEL